MQRPLKNRRERTDAELVRRAAAGDPGALTEIDRRYRRRLVMYARSLLSRSVHDAEDVVQDVFVKAHVELAAGRGPQHLGPWMFRLTRNRAIDETRRARWGEASLDAVEASESPVDLTDPPDVLHRRESLRALVADLADLPVSQRRALLSRVVDGESPRESAERLGVSIEAVQMLVVRGRRNLEKVRAARRATGDIETQLMALASPPAIVGLLAVSKFVGAGGGKLVVAGVSAVVAAAVAVGGFEIVGSTKAGPGEPTPFFVQGADEVIGHHLDAGQRLPANTAVVGLAVKVPAGPRGAAYRSVTMQCPKGMRYAAWIPREQNAVVLAHHMDLEPADPLGPPHADGTATFVLHGRQLQAPATVYVRMLCRTPGPDGSLVEHPRLPRPGEGRGITCKSANMYTYPHGHRTPVGLIGRGQHVAITTVKGNRVRIVEQTRFSGWAPATILCRGWSKPAAAGPR